MANLVELKGDDVFTTSLIIAEETGNKHKSVVALIKKHRSDFEDFGKICFSDLKSLNPKGGRPQRVYYLNEEQATLLVTYLDNNDIVRAFKKELVRQFYAMRKLLLERQTQTWQETRYQGKLTRKSETDVIKQLIEYAHEQAAKLLNVSARSAESGSRVLEHGTPELVQAVETYWPASGAFAQK